MDSSKNSSDQSPRNALKFAMDFMARREYSEKELAEKLREQRFSEVEINDALLKAKENGKGV